MAFFSVFLLFGLGFLWMIVLRPALAVLGARSWEPVSCVVEHAEVVRHSSSDGATYSIGVRYRYRAGGAEHVGERYSFSFGSSSGRDWREERVAELLREPERTCWVDPGDPSRAVLDRSTPQDLWFGLLPLVFVAVGGGGIFFTLRGARRRRARRERIAGRARAAGLGTAERSACVPSAELLEAGPLQRALTSRRLGRLGAVALATALWNGVVSVFVVLAYQGFAAGNPSWFLTIFLVPFLGVGLFLLGALVHAALGLLNPRTRLTLEVPAVPVGGSVQLTWDLEGRLERVRQLRIVLEGLEQATYRRGTHVHTDQRVFAREVLFECDRPRDMAHGRVEVAIPEGSMHTFEAESNRVVWKLRVLGEIPRWPDVEDELELPVLPAGERA